MVQKLYTLCIPMEEPTLYTQATNLPNCTELPYLGRVRQALH